MNDIMRIADMDFEELVSWYTGRLTLAISKDKFRDEVSIMVQQLMQLGYDSVLRERMKSKGKKR